MCSKVTLTCDCKRTFSGFEDAIYDVRLRLHQHAVALRCIRGNDEEVWDNIISKQVQYWRDAPRALPATARAAAPPENGAPATGFEPLALRTAAARAAAPPGNGAPARGSVSGAFLSTDTMLLRQIITVLEALILILLRKI
jgi:hypothetical protein